MSDQVPTCLERVVQLDSFPFCLVSCGRPLQRNTLPPWGGGVNKDRATRATGNIPRQIRLINSHSKSQNVSNINLNQKMIFFALSSLAILRVLFIYFDI